MAKFPMMPLWVDAYTADTVHLTAEQDGYYLRLLMLLWRSPGQRIPNDDAWIGPRLRATSEAMAAIVRPIIQEFCRCDGNWIRHSRLTKEGERAAALSQKQSDNAKSRWNKEKDACQRNAPIPILRKKESNNQKGAIQGEEEVKTYAFESGVIRLTQKDFDNWKASFSYLDLRSELQGAREWAEKLGPKWFFPVSKLLAKKNRDAKHRLDAGPVVEPAFKWPSNVEGVI